MDDIERLGWYQFGPRGYLVGEAAKRLSGTNGRPIWIYDRCACIVLYGPVQLRTTSSDMRATERSFAFRLSDGQDFPSFLKPVFAKHFFGKAKCAKCKLTITGLQTRALTAFDTVKSTYLTCSCGYPGWFLESDLHTAAECAMNRAQISWLRTTRMKAAGGKHSPQEIKDILSIQDNRCFYCNCLFTDVQRPSKDHLLPLTQGGPAWALNIVMACRSCNSSRGNLPFRTYCKLLSPTANKRILAQLRKRLLRLDIDNLPEEVRSSFERGIALHNTQHYRYREGARKSERKNAAKNRLLPRTIKLLLGKQRP
jgi:5-methylcytosine-specific restriction endonuclease McrA